MKKSCVGCRAVENSYCSLGYKIRRNNLRIFGDNLPLEDCPKPKTYDLYFELLEEMRARNNKGNNP